MRHIAMWLNLELKTRPKQLGCLPLAIALPEGTHFWSSDVFGAVPFHLLPFRPVPLRQPHC
jgi:hypothetical protein